MKKIDDTATGSWTPDNNRTSSTVKNSCHPNLKMFLAALSFAYFAKALSGSYMKSTITQLERRFDIPSYLIGIIDGSFEIGNLLVIAFVSYFGAKLHRPKIIAIGCILMSFGTFLIAMPHFIIGRYKIETSVRWSVNSTNNLSPCPASSPESTRAGDRPSILPSRGCERESSVSMWIYVFLGNVLRGIGETPVQPLGISYIDDYAQSENAALYIGCVQTISIIGPVFGYLLGSLCAKIYVDVGYVDMETVTITPGDARWVGAWWLGYLIAGTITLMSAVPFWFLPKSLPMPLDKHDSNCTPEQTRFIKDSPTMEHKFRPEEPVNLQQMVKEFVPTLKSLLGNPVYITFLCVTIIQFNSLIGMVTYKPKYIEQHYGQSASKANFLMGMINIPAVALGMFSGGVVMKKYKLGIMGAAKFAFGTSLLGYFLSLFFLALGCENSKVAGITVSYSGSGIQCVERMGSPMFLPAWLDAPPPPALVEIRSFVISLGGTPGFMLLVRCIKPELKSFALGIYTLATRTLAGIPAPIYFGALIDTTCLKWGNKMCGGRGACRIYNTSAYRIVYLGLTLGLRTVSFFLCISGFVLLKRHIKREERSALTNGSVELESLRKEEDSSVHCEQFIPALDCNPDRETRL
ncbi:solute carrier organic anion transporter family member 1C1 isoform X2 [Sebastes umbrosus]|uniref:solute carrier organic anion transporter family member 1C1 isoform X2 n=1 Tax=Sebastes umbrosus TaxID=72105 RepID=UPI00189E094A|nr:solute carrier organic anion transporter family member 1C1 isoform X2 [Sebastes umbrosus]